MAREYPFVAPATSNVTVPIAYSDLILTGQVLNADLAGGIAYSKLVLTGAVTNADLAGSIAYSKLVLTGAVTNADLAGSIAYSKLSIASGDITRAKIAAGTADHVVINDGTGNLSSEAQLAITRGGTGQSTAANAINALLPTQTSNSGKFLTTNGSSASWGTPGGAPEGTVVAYAGSAAPTGWLLCYGQAVSRSTYSALFTAIGTTYGVGDGSTTFNVPDLRGRAVAGVDNMGGSAASRITSGGSGITGATLGAAGGAETHTLDSSQMPSHNHSLTINGALVYQAATGGSGANNQNNTNGANTGGQLWTINNTGGGGAHNNTQPTIMLNYIIKT